MRPTSAGLRRLGLASSRYCGAQRLFRLWSKGPVVLFYHGVEENLLDSTVQQLHLPLQTFERQIAFLRRHREVISMDDLYECIANRHNLDSRQVIITFDDGYKNNLRIVAPLLKSWNLPFTIFVSSRHISESLRFPTYYIRAAILYTQKETVYLRSINMGFDLRTREKRLVAAKRIQEFAKRTSLDIAKQIRQECLEQLPSEKWAELNARFNSDEPMTWGEVKAAASLGATIGSHCHDHCILNENQARAEVHRQLTLSKAAIDQNVMECKYMAYPNGTADDVSSVAHSAVKAAQFRLAFTTIEGEVSPDCDCFLMPRIFGQPQYEEFCYVLNRTSKQNEVYRRTRSLLWDRFAAQGDKVISA